MIEFSIKKQAAAYAALLDKECTARDCGLDYADIRETQLSLGAFRAFEWLEKNGYKVVPE